MSFYGPLNDVPLTATRQTTVRYLQTPLKTHLHTVPLGRRAIHEDVVVGTLKVLAKRGAPQHWTFWFIAVWKRGGGSGFRA